MRLVLGLSCALILVTFSTPVPGQEPAGDATVDADGHQQPTALPGVPVFEAGKDGYHTFRIPAVIRAANGDLLAFCEGRVASSSDAGNIDLVMRRSTDRGATWGKLEVIADNGDGVFGNPAPVLDRKSGQLLLLMVRQEAGSHEADIRHGKHGSRTPYIVRSKDHGMTWSSPESLLRTCDRDNWGWYATGPCHGIQLEHGEHAGRLVVPANHSSIEHQGALSAHLLLSDDGGASWRIGAVDESNLKSNRINPNESSVAESADATLYVTSRDHGGSSPSNRAHTWSSDGGETFTTPFASAEGNTTPVCQASVLSVKDALLMSAPSKSKARERLTLRMSEDRGQTWQEVALVDPGFAAYSDLVRIDETMLGVLYEVDGYGGIRFVPLALEDVLAPMDRAATPNKKR